jgi:hypothetical protein
MIGDSLRRKILYNIAVLPFLGRNMYERLNSRLDRQIKIRETKRNSTSKIKKTKLLFPHYQDESSPKQLFFDSL